VLSINKKIIVIITVTFCAGLYTGASYFPRYVEKIIEKPAEIKETVRHETETVIRYVPKEIIVYKDPVTKEAATRKENTDVEASIGQPSVNVKVNGQPYSFNLLQGEKQKFEDGKLVLNQSSNVGIELSVKPQVIDQTKHWSVGVGYGGNGVSGKVDFPLGKSEKFGGWVYGDKKAGVVGVSVRF
jgi:hypothetical protein